MIDEARQVATLGRVNNRLHVNTEEVGRPDANLLILDLPQVSDDGPDALTNVLNHHLVRPYGLHGKETPVVDARFPEPQQLLAELKYEGWF